MTQRTAAARSFERSLTHQTVLSPSRLELTSGSRVAVLGGGPAGSFFSYFLLDMARRAGLDIQVDIYERRQFTAIGPSGCNMCGGIISESLVQALATDGINLPPSVVERGIDSYVLHMDVGSVAIDTPLQEKRIASVHRGGGPKDAKEVRWSSFDAHLLALAQEQGASVLEGRVDEVLLEDGRPRLMMKGAGKPSYDLLAVAVGVNTGILKAFENLAIDYTQPRTTGTYICEFFLGEQLIEKHLGTAMHVFLLNLPRLEFAAIIPKGEYLSLCLLGREIDDGLIASFLNSSEVRRILPEGWELPSTFCTCRPRISVAAAEVPYADRLVFIGDSGATRLYKDGIGAAYRTAKAAAATAIFQGIASEDFRRHYRPVCKAIERDNLLGRMVFQVTREIQRRRFERRGVLRMVSKEQSGGDADRPMSTVLWDTFTGSAPYREILLRTLRPGFLARLAWETIAGVAGGNGRSGAISAVRGETPISTIDH
jgi:hypothetical protein